MRSEAQLGCSSGVIKLGNVYANPRNVGGNGRAPVFSATGIAPVIVGMGGGGNKPHVIRIFDLPTSTGKVHQDSGVYDGGVYHAHSER